MRHALLSGLSSLLLPFGLYGAGAIAAPSYQRSYLSASISASTDLLLRSDNSLPQDLIDLSGDQLDIQSAHPVRELVIVDGAVTEADKSVLRRALKPGVQLVELDSSTAGLPQLINVLDGHKNLAAIHVVSHAEAGVILLGNSRITPETIQQEVHAFALLKGAVREGGDLLFYGCDLAANEAGEELLDIISNKTGLDIAASNNLTGNAELQGDWELEVTRGNIESTLAFSEKALRDFSGVLAPVANGTYNFAGWTGIAQLSTTHFNLSAKSGDGATQNLGNDIGSFAYMLGGAGTTNHYFYLRADGVNTTAFELTGLTGGEATDPAYTSQFTNLRIVGYLHSGGTVTSLTVDGSGGKETFTFGAGQLGSFSGVKLKGFKLFFDCASACNNLASDYPGYFEFYGFTIVNAIDTPAADSDATLTAAGGVSEPVGLATTIDTVGEAVDIFDFTITDGGTSDSLATTVSQIVVNVIGTSTDAERGKITWRLNGPDVSNVTGTYSAGADTITFSGLSMSVANGGNETYTVNAYYNDNTTLTEDHTIILSVDGDTNLTVGGAGTQMGATTPVTNGSGTTIDVVASQLVFTTQPAGSVSGAALTTQPIIAARDAFGNTDVDFTETITLTEASAGTLTNATQAATAGVATFTNLTYTATADQQAFTLTANDQDGVGSNLPTVDASSVTSDVVATQLVFDTQPAPTSVISGQNTAFSTVPIVSARDANSIVDTGYATGITLAEMNGAGSATMAGTGDTDGNGATVSITPSSGVATFTGLQMTYTASGGSDETFNLRASSGGLTTADSSQLTSTTTPTVSSVGVPADDTYIAGQNLDFTVNTSQNITVDTGGGTPRIALTLGAATVYASYSSGSGSSALTFRYTVQTGDLDTNGIAAAAGIELNGGTLKDGSNNDLTLTLNSVGSLTAVLVDAVVPNAPTGLNLTAGSDSGSSATDDYTSDTTPTLTGSAEANSTVRIYDTDGTTVLVTTTANGIGNWLTTSSALADGAHSLTAKATDAAGNESVASTALVVTIDTTAPTVTDANISIAGGTGTAGAYIAGDTVTASWNNTAIGDNNSDTMSAVTVDFSQFGGGAAVAATNSSGTWTATYTLVAGAINSSNRNVSVTVTDNAGNTRTQADSSNAVVDNVLPAVGSVGVPANATYIVGQNLDFTVNTTEAITVSTAGGTPRIALTIGSATVYASYLSGSGSNALTFRYTVQSGDLDTDGIAVAGLIETNGGILKDSLGNTLNSALNSVGNTTAVLVDAIAPTVSSVTVPANDTYVVGETLSFTVSSTENVTVNTGGGTPRIAVTIGGTTRYAAYISGSGTTNLVFSYTVQVGDNDTDGIALASSIDANGGTLLDGAGNDLVLTLHSVGSTIAILVDTAAPTVQSLNPVDGDVGVAVGANFVLTMNEDIQLGTGNIVIYDADDLAVATIDVTAHAGQLSTAGGMLTINPTANLVENTSYYIQIANGAITDLADNIYAGISNKTDWNFTVADVTPSIVTGVVVSGSPAANAASLVFTVSFDEVVNNLSADDFVLTATGSASGSIASVSAASGTSVDVTVNTVSGTGSLRLDVKANSNIQDASGNGNGTNGYTAAYTGGASHAVDRDPPLAPSGLDLAAGSDSGISSTDNVTKDTTPTFTGSAEANSTVTLTSSIDGALGTTTADGAGNWSFTTPLLTSNSAHNITATATDAAGNTGAASTALVLTLDTQTPTITSSAPAGGASAADVSVIFNLAFSESVNSLTTDDFALVSTGTASGSISSVSVSSGAGVAVTVNGISGTGSLKVDHTASDIVDDAGNALGVYSAGTPHSVDTDAPTIASVSFDQASVTQANQGMISLTLASAEVGTSANYTITGSSGTPVTGTIAVVSASQQITNINVSGLGDGTLTLSLTLTDTAGNVSSPAVTDTISKDAAIPAVSVVNVNDGHYGVGSAIDITLTLTEDVVVSGTLSTLSLDIDGMARQAIFVSAVSGVLTYRYTVQAGDNTGASGLIVDANGIVLNGDTMRDAGSNDADLSYSQWDSVNVIVDTTAPVDPIVTTPAGTISTNQATTLVSGTHAEDGVTISLYADVDNDGVADNATVLDDTIVVAGAWTLSASLSTDSDNNFVVVARDAASNVSAPQNVPTITQDSMAPAAPSTPDLDAASDSGTSSADDITKNTTLVLTGTAEAGASVVLSSQLDGELGTVNADGSGDWSVSATNVSAGTHSITAAATDIAGNSSVASSALSVTIDTSAPTSSVIDNQHIQPGESSSTLAFTIADDVTAVTDILVTPASSDTTVVPLADIVLAGSNADRSVTVTALGSGTSTITLTLEDGAGNTSTQTFEVVVNSAPTILGTPATNVAQGAPYSFVPTGADADGNSLLFGITNRPAWASFNTATGELSGTPTNADVGVTTAIVISVSDGVLSASLSAFNLTVTNVNDAPTISSTAITAATQDAAYSYSFAASDTDVGDVLTLSAVTKPSWLSFNAASGVLSGTPSNSDVGSHAVTLRVSDTDGLTAEQSFSITVTNVNDAPTISSTAITTATQDVAYSYSFVASDSDTGDSLTLSAVTKPSWLSFNAATGVLSGTPGNADVGAHPVLLRVTDADGLTAEQSFSITVTNVNDAPTISSTAITAATQDAAYSYSFAASDSDVSDVLTLSAVTKPNWLSFNAASGVLSGMPSNADVGAHPVILRVTDTDGLTAEQSFSIQVTNVNDAPTISSTAITTATQDTAYSYTFVASDTDVGDVLTLSAVTKPSWLSFNATSGVLSGTPSNSDVGSHAVTLRVGDTDGLTAEQSFSIQVTNINDAPIAIGSTVTLEEDSSLMITLAAEDADSDPLTYEVVAQPESGTLEQHGSVWLYIPEKDFNGTDLISFIAKDVELSSEPGTVTITVTPVNDEPQAVDDSYTLISTANDTYSLAVLANDVDVDGDPLTIDGAAADIGNVQIGDGGLIFTAPEAYVGPVALRYTISDGNKGRATAKVIVLIEGAESDNQPVITLPDDVEVNATGLFTRVKLGFAKAVDRNGHPLPVSLVNKSLFFAPGSYLAYWQAVDRDGNKAIKAQKVKVNPLISLSKDQVVGEGNEVIVSVHLNGEAPIYPLSIPYTVSGSAGNADHDLVDGVVEIISGQMTQIRFSTIEDGVVEGDEDVLINLDTGLNLGSKKQTQVLITEANIAPKVSLAVTQAGAHQFIVAQNGGEVHIHAQVTDANMQDSLTLSWNSGSLSLQSDDAGMFFSPVAVQPGIYPVSLTATDDGLPARSTTEKVYIVVRPSLPVLTGDDTDDDLIPDDQEGFTDTDSDGIPDYLDANGDCSVMPEGELEPVYFLAEGQAGVCLRLGHIALRQGQSGVQLPSNAVAEDTLAANVGGIFDFIATGLPQQGQSYSLVLPQRAPIPANAVYRKFNTPNGWQDFVIDERNNVASTEGERGFCPPPGDSRWAPGLTEGHWCVQLTIEDGGPNDDDGVANRTIVDPSGVSVMLNGNHLPVANPDAASIPWNQSLDVSVLANDTDSDGDSLTVTQVISEFGTVVILANQQLSYMPATDFIGTDVLVYSITDGKGGTASSELTVTVNGNAAPIAVNDNAATDDRTSLLLDVLSNDTDADGNGLTLVGASAQQGTVSIESNKLRYIPKTGFDGVDTVTYQVSDGLGGEASGQALITVKAYQEVVIDNKSGGGSMALWALALILVGGFMRHREWQKLALGALLLLSSIQQANASDWYVEGFIGQAQADSGMQDLQPQVGAGVVTSIDNSDTAFGVSVGYQWTPTVAVELAYADFGEASARIEGASLTPEQYHELVKTVTPVLADGVMLGLRFTLLQHEYWRFEVPVGLFHWQADISSTMGNTSLKTDLDGTDWYAGVRFSYQLTDAWSVGLGYQYVDIEPNDFLSSQFNLRYQF
ncbi:Ig-like domain-containing protein [Shewanella sp. CG12_big_fil_rev_8_21_14_0_65_47_15]|uniref:Ig-like domain-containing protein n=1 Tax=Shewanella sp. CG12_big_fil_rev_8_21_14_0_65_47_15 TaxID=1975537 RepID=UPI000CC2CB9E|nr:Ig-like domain-containing protein [Shewanella sp. CG12_big_fil_rev_8_21_14_0_65_47_15]PIW60180.1 MAG: adhesin [Shewanella sp. CG12_big_fil_rev_8_21_14_0_65_47_15]